MTALEITGKRRNLEISYAETARVGPLDTTHGNSFFQVSLYVRVRVASLAEDDLRFFVAGPDDSDLSLVVMVAQDSLETVEYWLVHVHKHASLPRGKFNATPFKLLMITLKGIAP